MAILNNLSKITMLRIFGLFLLFHSCQSGIVRRYYLAAEDVEWDYAPTNMNVITGNDVTEGSIEGKYLINGPDRIGKKYRKSSYFGYTDETFQTRVPTPESHGLLGPIIYGEVGDTIKILFKNMASMPYYSLHTHGMLYDKISEGAKYADGTSAKDKVDDSIDPGSNHTYEWRVEDISGPTDEESNCIAWPYHSHVLTAHDTNTGVVGASIICRPGILDDTGKRQDVDRDIVLLVTVIDENISHYIDRNIKDYCTEPDSVDPEDEDFYDSNLMHSINGYVFGNLPGLELCLGDRIAWHIFSLGTETDLHTLYFHGNILNIRGNRRDAFSTSPAYFLSGEMDANNPGTWLLTSEVFTHRLAGTQALYTVRKDCDNVAYVLETSITNTWQYYIKAEEVIWYYAPSGVDGFDQTSLTDPDSPGYPYFIDNQQRIGGSYKKAVFVEYTDNTFSTKVVRGQEEEHLGFLGPIIRAEVGDEILVTFYNDASRNYSIQAHGVLYDKANEGSGYNDGTNGADKADDSVPPGSEYTYRWIVPENYGPINPKDDCLTWVYYSAVDPERDVYSGLVGQLVICSQGTLNDAGRQKNEVSDFHLLLMILDENRSWYINENIELFTNLNPDDALDDEDFLESNKMHSINGYAFANLPGLDQTCVDQDVLWHLASLGGDTDEHTIYFRGHPVTFNNRRTDTVSLTPGNSVTVRMTPQRSGTWPIECMTGDHFVEGMKALYSVDSDCEEIPEEPLTNRTYYIAAVEGFWEFCPNKIDPITNRSLLEPESPGNIFVKREGPFIGSVYKKAAFRQYTDATFEQQLYEGSITESLGILGPMIHAEVGEQVIVVFKNEASRPYSMHPHGLIYDSSSGETRDPVVEPGKIHTYKWQVTPEVGPTEGDRNCILYAYYSDADRVKDTHSGLIGPLVICRKGVLGSDGKRADVDREFVLLFSVTDENQSWYLDENIEKFSPDPSLVDKEDPDFEESNLMHGMNGYVFDNLKHLEMYLGETVEWYLMGIGEEVDIHTVHFHGQPVVYQQWTQHRIDVVELFPGVFSTVQMNIKETGTWLLHCHVNDHMTAGMESTYKVLDPLVTDPEPSPSTQPWTTAGNSSAGYCTVLLLTNMFIALINIYEFYEFYL
ncbi:hephaestin-like protein [Amphiura filiformis]|uniref:hephaestin-like protein n=1 Tax=Amphiura filiformis TaxID=82378 RepID=UPI003B218B4B